MISKNPSLYLVFNSGNDVIFNGSLFTSLLCMDMKFSDTISSLAACNMSCLVCIHKIAIPAKALHHNKSTPNNLIKSVIYRLLYFL